MKIKCEFCGQMINPRGIAAHLQKKHGKTIKDNTLARLGKTEAEIPACRFCGKPVMVEVHGFSEICSSSECKSKLTHLHKSEAVSKQQRDLAKAGKHRFQSKNLTRDANGKSIKHIQLAKAQVDRGVHPLQKQNRPKAENGKDLYVHNRNLKLSSAYVQHRELLTKDYLLKNFVKNGKFLMARCMRFFNLSYLTIKRFKEANGINYPSLHEPKTIEQTDVVNYIRRIYSGPIEEGNRQIIAPYELDIYLPEKKLAIEFDGILFHSKGNNFPRNTDIISPDYHLKKTELCEQKGIQLLHIFEDEWMDCPEIWKSMIADRIGVFSNVLAARNGIVLDAVNPTEFLEENHLQGSIDSGINLGLFFNNEMLAVMSFRHMVSDRESVWELSRFCVKRGYHIHGAASKLLSSFRQKYPGSIISIADRRWSQGSLYRKLGFTLIGTEPPQISYFRLNKKAQEQFKGFRKNVPHKYLKVSEAEAPESSENMLNNGYRKIYDCGSLVFKLE